MKNLTLVVLLLISFTSFAQNKFIEVEVTDTISLKPQNFQFNVYLDDEIEVYNDDEEFDPLAEKEKNKNRLQEIKKMLEAKKYKVLPLDESKLNVFERRVWGDDEGFSIFISGEAEMKKLGDLLDSEEDIKTSVIVLKYADEEKAEDQLIKRLMEKAKVRASVIAGYTQLKVGDVFEVREGKQGDADFSDFYLQILKMSKMGQPREDHTGILSKTFVVKFAAQ